MHCSSCEAEILADSLFCTGCGTKIEVPCSACAARCRKCGSPLGVESRIADPGPRAATPDPRSYTPKHLAEKILQSKSALEGERKQVTVLFADVKGSMELAEQLDPEAWHEILDRFFQILSDGVHRFEGTVNQ